MSKVIVSLTSYPKRIGTINQVIESIIHQTILPDKIVLYLAEEQFETKEVVPDLDEYEKYGFELRWCKEDLGPHKKYFYAMQEFPDDIIITIDDDVIYKETMIKNLLAGHKKNPDAVISRRTHLITWTEEGAIASYTSWYGECIRYINEPRMDLVAIGCGGILYPPHILSQEVFNKANILLYCRYADDMWLKIMETINNVPTVLVQNSNEDDSIENYLESGLYTTHNANGGNDIQLQNLLREYYEYISSEDTLVACLKEQDCMKSMDVEKESNKDLIALISNIMNEIKNSDGLLIYGAGYFANMFYEVVKHYRVQDMVVAFVVENKENNPDTIDNIPVKEYKNFVSTKENVIIGLAYEKQDAVYNNLLSAGFAQDRLHMLSRIMLKALKYVRDTIFDSTEYWDERYTKGGNSGAGSYNRLADFKASVINRFVKKNNIDSVIEFGCGDGNQLSLANYPQYVGFDVSKKAIEICKSKFQNDNTKEFIWCGDENFENDRVSNLVLSLDVIYHLIEDDVYEKYMRRLFASSKKYVCIYSSNEEGQIAKHVKHRKFTEWIDANLKDEWKMVEKIRNEYPYMEENPANTSFSDFYFYEKKQ